ncbi:MAG: SGNH/GDSL hydrolase family protein [Clostridia bacterium]|nr:SGNH/GDSL hydrolase family protein [Clostridia bacterium]
MINSQWQGKKIAFLGDSITEGVGVKKGECFWNYLEQKLGCISYSFGKSGELMRGLLPQVEELYASHGEKIDAIVIFAGTNDYNAGLPMGEWYTEPKDQEVIVGYEGEKALYATRKRREYNIDISTFRGSINALMSKVREYYPTKQVIFMTPLHRAYANYGGNNIQYDELHTDKGGYYVDEYVSVIKEAPNVWACDIIDLHSKSGLFPLNDKQAQVFFCNAETDRLHPNAAGHMRIAETMEIAMKNIPVFSR